MTVHNFKVLKLLLCMFCPWVEQHYILTNISKNRGAKNKGWINFCSSGAKYLEWCKVHTVCSFLFVLFNHSWRKRVVMVRRRRKRKCRAAKLRYCSPLFSDSKRTINQKITRRSNNECWLLFRYAETFSVLDSSNLARLPRVRFLVAPAQI